MKKKILLAVLALAIIGGGIGFYLFNKKVSGLENKKADYELTASQLYKSFDTMEDEATKKYIDKILLVEGAVVKSETGENFSTIILEAESALAGGINCSFDYSVPNVKKGQTVKIKGRCQGFLMDVVLNNCNIEEE